MKTNNIASSIRWLDVLLLFSHLSWEGTASTGDRHDDKQITHHTDVDQHSGNDSKQTECRLWFDSVYLIYILMWRRWQRLPLYFCYSLRVRLGCWELNWLGLTWLCIALTPAMKMLVHWCNHFRQTICTAIEIFGTTELNEWVWHLPTDISAMNEAKGRTYKTHIGFRLTHTHTLGTELNW